jgi:hypothetical protein
MSSMTRLALLERAALTRDHVERSRPNRSVPRAFVPLAWACLLLVVLAGVQQRVREHGNGGPRTRTSLHVTRIAYAGNRFEP